MVRPERFELPTPCFVGKCSIQLSYGRNFRSFLAALSDCPTQSLQQTTTGWKAPALWAVDYKSTVVMNGFTPLAAEYSRGASRLTDSPYSQQGTACPQMPPQNAFLRRVNS